MKFIVTKNTYPKYPNAAYGEVGDIVKWERSSGRYSLVRVSDGKTVFSIGGLDGNGKKYSTKQPPILVGIIGQLKKYNYIFKIEEVGGNNEKK